MRRRRAGRLAAVRQKRKRRRRRRKRMPAAHRTPSGKAPPMLSADPPGVPTPERRPETAAVNGVLPSEPLIEILLLLPPKDVCRARAVCPSWRSLTYDRLFVASYAARHPGPLLAVHNGGGCLDLVEPVRGCRQTASHHHGGLLRSQGALFCDPLACVLLHLMSLGLRTMGMGAREHKL